MYHSFYTFWDNDTKLSQEGAWTTPIKDLFKQVLYGSPLIASEFVGPPPPPFSLFLLPP